jgi:ubiquinone/menaquinone biosynthesis C-methylase UbiE
MNKYIYKFYAFNCYNRDIWVESKVKNLKKDSIILDVGAGSAPYRKYFDHCIYKTQDFHQLDNSQLRGKSGYHKIDYVSDITNIPIENNTIDFILCTEVLEHVPDPISALKEMTRVLKNHGIILITAPLGSGLHQEPFHFYGGFTKYWYEKYLNLNSFEIIEISPNKGFYSHFSQELIRLFKRFSPIKSFVNLFFFPIWLFFIPLVIIFPIVSYFLDNYDNKDDFTIGYHVLAKKINL